MAKMEDSIRKEVDKMDRSSWKQSKKKKNVQLETLTTKVDSDGVVETQERQIIRAVQRDKFSMVYIEYLPILLGKISPAEAKIILAIVGLAEWNTGKVFLTKGVKEKIVKETNVSFSTVCNSIHKLATKKVLRRDASSEYTLNPSYFFKGEDIERSKLLSLNVQFRLFDSEDEVIAYNETELNEI